jgi:hypothetical protein
MGHLDGEGTGPCPDCGVAIGAAHDDGCDVARCHATGRQRLSCDHEHDCGAEAWTGTWPGVVECVELGLWAHFVPNGNPSWRPCGPDHPNAVPDLNRLVREGVWDKTAKRWTMAVGS